MDLLLVLNSVAVIPVFHHMVIYFTFLTTQLLADVNNIIL